MIGSRDLHKAVSAAWVAESLDDLFTAYWSDGEADEFLVLNEQEAAPEQPWPYCVFSQEEAIGIGRMTATANSRREVRQIPWEFRVFAKTVGSNAAKDIAGDLAQSIMQVFGGHPTVAPTTLTLDTGSHLITQYDTDYSLRKGDSEWCWIVRYVFHVDVPVMN